MSADIVTHNSTEPRYSFCYALWWLRFRDRVRKVVEDNRQDTVNMRKAIQTVFVSIPPLVRYTFSA